MSYPRGMTQKADATFTLPGMAFARDGSGGEYHLLEDGSIGYYSSEGEAGRLAESMDDLFSLLVSCICWHDCCDTKQYVDSKTLEELISQTHLSWVEEPTGRTLYSAQLSSTSIRLLHKV
ncbi:hypothetical protein OBE_13770, partial [human gut metagenome]